MYRSHVLVCGGTGCTSSGSQKIIDMLESELKTRRTQLEESGIEKAIEELNKNLGALTGAEEDLALCREAEEKLSKCQAEYRNINFKLNKAYRDKSEINAKLQQTYKEKSELNAKLQKTYKEKSEKTKQIKRLEKWSVYPLLRKVKRLFKKK